MKKIQINSNAVQAAMFLLLVVAGVSARIAFQHIPNFAPVAALALFAGFFFKSRWIAVCVPLSVMLISDQLIDAGGYPLALMLAVYGLLALPVFLRAFLDRYVDLQSRQIGRLLKSALAIFGSGLACSLLFFFGTNFAVWATTSLYPQTLSGLGVCYAAALPFFRYTLTGDLLFSALFFGGYAAVKIAAETVAAPAPASSTH